MKFDSGRHASVLATKRGGAKTASTYTILEGGVTNIVSAALLDAKLGVAGSIRIRESEYDDIDPYHGYFTHFNLEFSGHRIGKRYALPKILVSGYYKSDEDELPPLLSFEGIYFSTAIKVIEHVPYKALRLEYFAHSMRHIKNEEELRRAILKRYLVSMPGLSEERILSMGVSITTLLLEPS